MMPLKIALAGNPNSGKTTMFNALTVSNQYIGNWPGVTVEKKEGKLKGQKDITIIDLPGIYSLSPYTLEEVIARNYLIEEKPNAIINIVDASNIERNLYLTTQLLELGIPVLIALNMMDVVEKNGDVINAKKLAEAMGCEVVFVSAAQGRGIKETAEKAVKLAKEKSIPRSKISFSKEVEQALGQIVNSLSSIPDEQKRYFAVKLFERDEKIIERVSLPAEIEQVITAVEEKMDDDSESIIVNERYNVITSIIKDCVVKKSQGQMTVSDKIDIVVTNRIFALPIFAVIMFLVYYISVTTVGDWVTNWTNDTFFGEMVSENLAVWLEGIGVAGWLTGLIVDGIVGGVGAVLGFVPQMLILFFFLAVLEECGYMARVAFIMDRIFRRFGLSGKSFIPMLIGSGCGVPGIMASRTIESERDRRMTIMTTTFIPCGAKMPIIALIAGVIFGGTWWVAPSAYFAGVASIIISGIILKKTKMFAGDPAPFVMELPRYHLPRASSVLRSMWERGYSFIRKAGTIILLSSIIIWFLSNFGVIDGSFDMVEDIDHSIVAVIGSFLAPIFAPLGFGQWEAAVATIMGLVAKEEVVGVFGVLYGISGDALALVEDGIFSGLGDVASAFTPLSGYSFLLFNLLCAPCFAAIGAIKREMNNAKWTWFAIGYQTIYAYAVSLSIYQLGMFFTGHGFNFGTLVAFLVVMTFLVLLFRPQRHVTKGKVNIKEEAYA